MEVIEAYLYYENKRKGLAERFLEHLETYFNRLSITPEIFPQKRKPYREAVVNHFPFIIIYEIRIDKVVVYSVFNTRHDPHGKKK